MANSKILSFPPSAFSRPEAREIAAPSANAPPMISALLVSPFSSDHRAVGNVFEQWRWELWTAYDGEEAFELLNHIWVPVILCERNLKDGAWIDFLRPVCALRPRVIVLGRSGLEEIADEVSRLGGFAVLESPPDDRELAAVVSLAWHSACRQWQALRAGLTV